MRRRQLLLPALLTLPALVGLASVLAGSWAVRSAPAEIGPPPEDSRLIDVVFEGEQGDLAGWYGRPTQSDSCVLLVHGNRSDRRAMLPRARWLMAQGYAVLLVDLQAHGESAGQMVTFGHRESDDVRTAVAWLRAKHCDDGLAVLGTSLGGAAALLGEETLDVDALVVESVYATFEEATANRLGVYLGAWAMPLHPVLTWQLAPRIGASSRDLCPECVMDRQVAPVFVMSGMEDRRTSLNEATRLWQRALGSKELWLVPGASHEDLHRFAGADYERRVLAFLSRHMGAVKRPAPRG